jgi:uncharacterized phiE125 gp8 family phage protein
MGYKLVTAPAETPVTLTEAKAQLSVDHDHDDVLIASMIEAATASLDGLYGDLGRCLKPQTWDYYRDTFPDCNGGIRLILPPLISVSSVNYIDPDTETETVFSSSSYEVDTASVLGWIVPGDDGWPDAMETINAVRVRFVAGYPDTSDSPPATTVPAPIRHAILLMVRDLYDNRGSFVTGTIVSQIPDAIERLVSPYRVITL